MEIFGKTIETATNFVPMCYAVKLPNQSWYEEILKHAWKKFRVTFQKPIAECLESALYLLILPQINVWRPAMTPHDSRMIKLV